MPYSRLLDFDSAFESLGRASKQRSEILAYINVEPSFDLLRHDPRFENLRKDVSASSSTLMD